MAGNNREETDMLRKVWVTFLMFAPIWVVYNQGSCYFDSRYYAYIYATINKYMAVAMLIMSAITTIIVLSLLQEAATKLGWVLVGIFLGICFTGMTAIFCPGLSFQLFYFLVWCSGYFCVPLLIRILI